MDLEKEEIHLKMESREFNSLSIHESIPIKVEKADFCTSSFLYFWSPLSFHGSNRRRG